ncbi:MAG TPA: proteasome assembly chaperone family protein [Candidatus Altiarchaeales archaeon]|nr:proteasome assembly chaperone family protein [Candidatus Altiarchaeales archaeon]
MTKMDNGVEIKEIGNVPENANVILGLPDVGLVGTIAAAHIIEEMNLKEIAQVDSRMFPPVMVVHKHMPKSPIRVYGNGNLLVIISEIPITPELINPLIESIVEWLKSKNINQLISIGGIPHPKRMEIEKPRIYGIGTDKNFDKIFKKNDINAFEEGLIVGPSGVMLKKCMLEGIKAMYLMAESHYKYPDPGAAASVISAINRIFGTKISIKSLEEKEEEIRLTARDLMKRTENTLKEMQKTQEKEIPMMYR